MSPETLVMKKRDYSEQRSPTLNTVLMVEGTLSKAGEVLTIGKLKRMFPKQVMHQTLMAVIDYLEYSGKIIVHDDKVLWAFKPQSKLKNIFQIPHHIFHNILHLKFRSLRLQSSITVIGYTFLVSFSISFFAPLVTASFIWLMSISVHHPVRYMLRTLFEVFPFRYTFKVDISM